MSYKPKWAGRCDKCGETVLDIHAVNGPDILGMKHEDCGGVYMFTPAREWTPDSRNLEGATVALQLATDYLREGELERAGETLIAAHELLDVVEGDHMAARFRTIATDYIRATLKKSSV